VTKKKASNLTLNKTVMDAADRLIDRRGYTSLTGLVEDLIRREHERVFGLVELKVSSSTPGSMASDVIDILQSGKKSPPITPQKTLPPEDGPQD
jgi:hypothetical protein